MRKAPSAGARLGAPWGVKGGPRSAPASLSAGFTLLELLVVIGLIAGLSFVLFIGLQGGGQAASLQAGQATVANLVTSARLKAAATGRHCRVLVGNDPADAERYLRTLVLQLARTAGPNPVQWETVQTVSLPAGVFVLPAALGTPTGLVDDTSQWRRVSEPGEELASGVFRNQAVIIALEGDRVARQWTGLSFTPNGTLAPLAGGPPPRGFLVLAPGGIRAPGSYAAGESPVRLNNPQAVRGLVLSAYGVPALLNERDAF
jgi:prepilin-type N-terminal cleavage/methylation domain-containing protein